MTPLVPPTRYGQCRKFKKKVRGGDDFFFEFYEKSGTSTIYELTFYERSVPPAWLDEIVAKLYHEHELAGDDEGGPSVVKGVYALEFHKWVANHVVKKVDPTFRVDDGYIGRGRQARAIHEALAKWAAAGDA